MFDESIKFEEILEEDPIRFLSEVDKQKFLKLWHRRTIPALQSIVDTTNGEIPLIYINSGRVLVKIKLGDTELLVRSLAEGSSYGLSELALRVLFKNSFLTDENSDVYYLSQREFLDFFTENSKRIQLWEKFCQDILLRDELRIHPYFRKLSIQEIIELSQLLKKEKIPKGKILIKEGSKSSSLFFIQSGRFKITKSNWTKDYFSYVEAGSVLGEMGVLEKKARNATVTAIQDSVVFELSAKDAEQFLKKSESLYSTLKSILKTRKHTQEAEVEDDLLLHSDDDAEEDKVHFIPNINFSPIKKWLKEFPIFLEESANETAKACRQMILSYWGYHSKLYEEDSKFPNSDFDVNMKSWKETFVDIGQVLVLDKIKYRKELKNHIYIVRWETHKFVIVLETGADQVKIVDPSFGTKYVSQNEWDSKSGKHAIIFIPKIKPFRNYLPKYDYFPGLFQYFRTNLSFLLSGILATFLIKVLEVSLPLVNLYLIDNVLIRESKEFFTPVLAGVCFLSLSQILFSYLRNNVLYFSTSKVNQTIIVRFLEKLLSLPISFFENHRKGEILQRWEEIENVTQFFSEHGTIKILDWLFGISVFTLFLFLSPSLLFVILIFILPELFILSKISPLIERETKKESLRSADTLSYFIETINGNETVKNLGAVSVQRWDFEKRLTSQLNAESSRMFYTHLLESSSLTFRMLTNVCVLLLGTYQIFSDQITLGALFAVIGLIHYVRSPMISLVKDGVIFQRAKIAWKRLIDWDKLESESPADARIKRIEIPDIQGDLEFKNVSFEYRVGKREFGLKNLNLKIESGGKYAFVGRSGSGKSTILKLFLGMYEISEGEITLDGVPLDEIWLPSYRSRIGVVYQENPILMGTIRENIALAKPESTLSEIVEAAKMAFLHEKIMDLPLGYDTELNDKTLILSGGQKQKLAFARLFLQKPALLILDEPTASMDRESEEKILANLNRVFANQTIVMVAHKLDTIRKYDRIFVLERGQIEETGTHKELFRKQGIYHLLHSKQEAIR